MKKVNLYEYDLTVRHKITEETLYAYRDKEAGYIVMSNGNKMPIKLADTYLEILADRQGWKRKKFEYVTNPFTGFKIRKDILDKHLEDNNMTYKQAMEGV